MQETRNAALPPAFVARLERLLGPPDRAAVLEAMTRPRATTFRVNPLLGTADALAELTPLGLAPEPLSWPPGAWWVEAAQRAALTASEPLRRGVLYVQNPASMLPPLLLAPSPEDQVLDLAAAPGSKTLQLAAAMDNRGWISAVEPVRERFFRLRANLERHGAVNVHTYCKDGAQVWRQVPERFDRVLLDAPCSSEGQFSLLEPHSFAYWSERKIREMAHKQKKLLYSAIQCLKPGGTLVYSTCTLAPEENEAIVDAMLRKFEGRVVVEPLGLPLAGAREGVTEWNGRRFDPSLRGALRILPDYWFEGFFLCRLRKDGSTVAAQSSR